jgi:TRAP transporter TAXI family solute receptor
MHATRYWLALGCALITGAASAQTPFKIVTASERGTYIQIGRDLAKFVAPAAGIELEALPSAGSAENVRRLRHEPGVKFALVQSDVYQAFLDQAESGNAEARQLIQPLRVIMPLYNEEIYFIARADAPYNFVHEIRDARINVGPLLSGTAMTATTIYRQMFGRPLAEAQSAYLTNEEALVKLIGDRSVDVVAVVAGQPAKLLVDMQPEARQLIKLLRFDATHPSGQTALRTYFAATIRAANYPNLLAEAIPGVADKA